VSAPGPENGRGGLSGLGRRSASGATERATDDRAGCSDYRFDPLGKPVEPRFGRTFENRDLMPGVTDDALVRLFMLPVRDGFNRAEQQQRREQDSGQPAEQDARPLHESR